MMSSPIFVRPSISRAAAMRSTVARARCRSLGPKATILYRAPSLGPVARPVIPMPRILRARIAEKAADMIKTGLDNQRHATIVEA